jgi:hypothetical protein
MIRRFQAMARGGGGGDAGSTATGQSEARQAASRVIAVGDERTNSLVVSAPDEYVPLIEELVREIDVLVDDITELRVFTLRYSDPFDVVDQIKELFPDESQTNNARGQTRFGGGRGGFAGRGGGGVAAAADSSDRLRRKGRVLAVADARTSSVVVSAASELMPQISEMIFQLDSNPARQQQVFMYSLDHAEAEQVAEVLREMFDPYGATTGRAGGARGANATSPLQNRQSNLLGPGGGTGTRGGAGGQTGNRGGQTRR